MTELMPFGKGAALLIVDVQKDFCSGGALAVANADTIVPVINDWIDRAQQRGIPVYASRDWHPIDHVSFVPEGGDWPPHCIQDTDGAMFHPDLRLPGNSTVVTKGVRFDRDQYSVFADTGLQAHLSRKGIKRLFVCGLAMDVCVRESVLDALKRGFEVVVIPAATRPVDPAKTQSISLQMQEAGAVLMDSDAGVVPPGGQQRAPGELSVCQKAPEWAEHQRLQDQDEPCDDGRSGRI